MTDNFLAKVAVGIVCCCGFGFATLLFFYAANPWIDHQEIPVFGSRQLDALLFSAAGFMCAFVTIRFAQGRRWAWWTAVAVSLLTLGLGVLLLYSSLQPQSDFARSESGFGIGISIILVTPSFVTGVLLALPRVRQRFAIPGC
jgi:hypothetical protein